MKKIDLIFFIFFLFNFLFYIKYHNLHKILLKAEDLWNDSFYSNKVSQYKIGNIIVMDFKEKVQVQQEVDSTKDKRLVIKLIPDKVLFDYLPDLKDDRSSQSQFRKNQKDRIDLTFKMALKIIQINTNENTISLEGFKQFTYNDVQYQIFFQGETNPNFIKNHTISSEYIYNSNFQVSIKELTNQNIQLQDEKIEINDETKRKIFIEYIKKILQEQSINVP